MDRSPGETVSGPTLLETKLYAPRWRPGQVSRPRLIERLSQGTARKLTLVSAPAGFGKSTLLAEWLTAVPAGGRPTAWLSLDDGDNDPARFWAYVVAALGKVAPAVGERASASLRSSQPPPIESILTTVINELSTVEDHVTLVLDDLHAIESQPVHDALAFLVDHLPPQLHLIVASRSDPSLPLTRLRARGELTEVRAADLRFTPDEAAAFLDQAMGLRLSAEDVAALDARTEGWIAGLQLAALSMRDRADVSSFIAAFAGDDRYIVDFLVEEVLQRQPERIRNFLLRTSFLDRLSASLCDAVTGQDDGAEMLGALERRNLFVVPLDDKRRWLRFHHLFADVLRAHAMEQQPDRIPDLRRRAAAWFEAHGMAAEAIEQARAAGDHEGVARLLVANVDALERIGQHVSIARWAASLPDDMVRARPRLALIHASVAMGTEPNLAAARRLTSWAEEAIARIEAGGGGDPLDDVDGTVVGPEGLDALRGEVLAQTLMHSARDLSPDEVEGMIERALTLLPARKQRVRGMLHLVRAGTQADRSDPEAALATLDDGADEARRIENHPLLACLLEQRGQVSMAMGRLDDGRRAFDEAIRARQHGSGDDGWVACGSRAGIAEILLEQGDVAGAAAQVAAALMPSDPLPMRSPILHLRGVAAQVMLAAGDPDGAMEQLDAAEAFARGVRPFRFASFLSSVQLTVRCRMGNLAAAEAVVRERGLSPEAAVDSDNAAEMIAYARFLTERGDPGDAVRVLARVLPAAHGRGRVRHEIHALALMALAYESLGDRPRALDALGQATLLGEPGRFRRTFLGEGPVMSRLVTALADACRRGDGAPECGSPSYLAELAAAAAAAADGVDPCVPGSDPVSTTTKAAAADLAEPLTTREVEVLRLIAAGLRNEQIAGELFISLSTVKRHIANAYGKLGVGHRVEAITRANALNLL